MTEIQLCVFASTPDMAELDFVVKVLTGTPEELARQAVEWGYDGIEFMPDPERVPDPQEMEKALRTVGAVMPVVNTGRMAPQRMALLHEDPAIRQRSIRAFKEMLDFAGYFKASGSVVLAPEGNPEPAARKALAYLQRLFRRDQRPV